MMRTALRTLLLVPVLTGCVATANFPGRAEHRAVGPVPAGPPPENGPAATGGAAAPGAVATVGIPVQVVSFNIQYGEEVEGALALIRRTPELAGADLILLQEMDAEGTERLARALEMGWVYYPAIVREGKLFGNAILSRWPLSDDRKLILPHRSWFGDTQRIAVAATATIRGETVRVYSVHLATPVNQGRPEREDQFRTVLADAERYPRVILGGDLNSDSLGELAVERGYFWPTRDGPRTVWFGRADHLLYRGLLPPWGLRSGTVENVGEVSDHRPVWARGTIR